MADKRPRIDSFDFPPGRVLAAKYRVDGLLGAGWEGEVYRVTELRTGISRAAKVFFPQRNPRDRVFLRYATKLDHLRDCPIVIQYHHSEAIRVRRTAITLLIGELVEGELLEEFVRRQPGGRMAPFEALHLLHSLTTGVEEIHDHGEYHGDLHDRNVLVRRRGVGFRLKLLDFYDWGRPSRAKMREDIVSLVRLLYDAVGGRRRYAAQPPEIKSICRGLRADLILRRFPTAGRLRTYLETFDWEAER